MGDVVPRPLRGLTDESSAFLCFFLLEGCCDIYSGAQGLSIVLSSGVISGSV